MILALAQGKCCCTPPFFFSLKMRNRRSATYVAKYEKVRMLSRLRIVHEEKTEKSRKHRIGLITPLFLLHPPFSPPPSLLAETPLKRRIKTSRRNQSLALFSTPPPRTLLQEHWAWKPIAPLVCPFVSDTHYRTSTVMFTGERQGADVRVQQATATCVQQGS